VKSIVYLLPRSVAKTLTIIASILTGLSVAVAISTYRFDYFEDWMKMLDLDREMNIPTWFSAFMLSSCAILLKAIATEQKERANRYYRKWNLLSSIFWFFAIDEVFSLHEIFIIPEIADALKLPWFLHSMWVIPGIIFVVWFVEHFWKFVMHLQARSRFHFFLAATIYLAGSLGMEMVGSYYSEWKTQQDLVYAMMTNVEEAMEMGGIIIFIYGLLIYLKQLTPHLDIQIKLIDDRSDLDKLNSY
jgi:hypothetical protein